MRSSRIILIAGVVTGLALSTAGAANARVDNDVAPATTAANSVHATSCSPPNGAATTRYSKPYAVKRVVKITTVRSSWIELTATIRHTGEFSFTKKGSVSVAKGATVEAVVAKVNASTSAKVATSVNLTDSTQVKKTLKATKKHKYGRLVFKHAGISFTYKFSRWSTKSCSYKRVYTGKGWLPYTTTDHDFWGAQYRKKMY